jgi:hypothetical protein
MLETRTTDDMIAEAKPIWEAGYRLLAIPQNMNPTRPGMKLMPNRKKALTKSGCLIVRKVLLRNLIAGAA